MAAQDVRLMAGLLFGVSPANPVTVISLPALGLAAFLAS
jgi:hypothetical protein